MTDSANAMDFESFYRTYHQKIVQYLFHRCSSWQDAEDLANNSFMYCMEHWDQFDPQKASRATWLYMVVKSRWKNYCRDHRQFDNLDDYENVLPTDDVMERTVAAGQIRQAIFEAMKVLPEPQRIAVLMRYFQNSSDEEIALKLKTSRGNVRVMIHRGLQRLQSVLPDELKEGLG